METTIVHVSMCAEEIEYDGEKMPLVWHKIPIDHGNLSIRLARPGKFAKHPKNAKIVFVYRGKE